MLIEHMLAREFGPALMDSPAMQQTVRDVQRVMDSDPAIRGELDSLIGSLRGDG